MVSNEEALFEFRLLLVPGNDETAINNHEIIINFIDILRDVNDHVVTEIS